MTDRIQGFIVTLDKDRREDDVEHWVNVLSMLRGVISVEPVGVEVADHMARERVMYELRTELRDVLWGKS